MPPQVAAKAADVGAQKAGMDAMRTLTLAVLAGAFIGLGAAFATTTGAGAAGELPFGVTRLLVGLVFSLGLILVVVAGAELFTGNNLIVMAWAERRIPLRRMLRNWALVYAGNLAGALATVGLVFAGRQYEFGDGGVGTSALAIAEANGDLGLVQALALGALCNALVCLAVWLCFSARSNVDRIFAIILPIAAFVASGFEHSIANLYFIPLGILLKDEETILAAGGPASDATANLTWSGFLYDNLLPVTLGNLIGGGLLVGAVYWLVYLRGDWVAGDRGAQTDGDGSGVEHAIARDEGWRIEVRRTR
jgi:formate transporter